MSEEADKIIPISAAIPEEDHNKIETLRRSTSPKMNKSQAIRMALRRGLDELLAEARG